MKKKIIVGVLALSLCFVALGATQVRGEESDIRSEMAALEAMLLQIQEQLTGQTGQTDQTPGTTVSISGIPSGFSFTRNLSQGTRGTDVRYLQIVLNAHPDTRLAQTGAGSPGNETDFFGPITRAAVNRFQSKYSSEVLAPIGLTNPTGFVGERTRAKLNSLLTEGVTTPTTPDNAIMETLKELADAIAALSERVDRLTDPTVGTEGNLSVELRADIRNAEVATNQTIEVAVFRVKAEDSDINLQRFDLYFDHDGANSVTATEFRRYVSKVALHSGDSKLQEITLSTTNPGRDDKYIRFSNLNLNVPKGEHRDITVEVTGTSRNETKVLEIGPTDANAIRGTDSAGVSQYTGGSAIRRTFTFTGEEVGALEIKRHADTLKEGVAMVSETRRTDVELLKFTLTAKDTAIELDELTVLIEKGNTALDLRDITQDILLYEGTNRVDVATVSGTTGKATFTNIEMDIARGATKTFTVKADVLRTDMDDQGAFLKASILKSDNEEIGFDINDAEVGIDRDIAGYNQHLYVSAPEITLDDSGIERNDNRDMADAYLVIEIEALEGDIEITAVNLIDTHWDVVMELDGVAFGGDWTVSRGDTAELEILGVFEATATEFGWVRLAIASIEWEDEEGNAFEWTSTAFKFIEDLRTDRVSLSQQ